MGSDLWGNYVLVEVSLTYEERKGLLVYTTYIHIEMHLLRYQSTIITGIASLWPIDQPPSGTENTDNSGYDS